MTQKPTDASDVRNKVSAERAGRLYRLAQAINGRPATRTALLRRLKVGMRTFYRDVDLLRDSGVAIDVVDGEYHLRDTLEAALGRIPFPDPELTFGDVLNLMKGRSLSHQRLKRLFKDLTA